MAFLMIIKNIYIEDFGCLSGVNETFNENLNIISSENETGKSTIAEFIKIMLYGVDAGPRSIRDNERTRFMPWGKNSMGGRLTFLHEGNEYTIIRKFGKRKSQDTISVINALTGAVENNLCIYSPGELLLKVGREGFEKSLYIKQLSTKLQANKDDEILQKLVNLVQSGDEETSYLRAMAILDAGIKELNATRPKGKILSVQDEINDVREIRTESENSKNRLEALSDKLNSLTEEKSVLEAFVPDKTKLMQLKSEYSKRLILQTEEKQRQQEFLQNKNAKAKAFLLQIIMAAVFCMVFLFFNPIFTIPFIIWGILSTVLFIKNKNKKNEIIHGEGANEIMRQADAEEQKIAGLEKQNTNKLIEVVRLIGETENAIGSMRIIPFSEIDERLCRLQKTHNELTALLDDIMLAKQCLQEAFEDLQKTFGKKLNDETSKVLNEISNGKYSNVLVDNNYDMFLMRADTNELIDAQYLSSGAYDQIYFALRMGIIQMLFKDAPIILDEAFAQYDEKRLHSALNYLKRQENRQMLLFSCHKREQLYFNENAS